MKQIILLAATLIIAVFHIHAQRISIWKQGENRALKGKLVAYTDSSISLVKQDSTVTIASKDIAIIRIRNGFGTNTLIFGGIAGVTGMALGIATGKETNNDGTWGAAFENLVSYSPGEGAAMGFFTGLAGGTLLAAGQAAIRGKTKFQIDGDPGKWKQLYMLLSQNPITSPKKS